MFNKATAQTSCIQKIHEADENIPPGSTAAAGTQKPKVQGGDGVVYSSTTPSGETKPLSDKPNFATPVRSKGGLQANSKTSGLQFALTPTLMRTFNVYSALEQQQHYNHASLEPLQHTNTARPAVPSFSSANSQKPAGRGGQHASSLRDSAAPVRWLHDESLPDITLLDVTSDSPMQLSSNVLELPDSMPVTPASVKQRRPEQAADMNPNSTMSSTLTPKMERSSMLLAGGILSSLEVTQDISTAESLKNSKLSSEIPISHDVTSTDDISAKCAVSQLSASDVPKDVTFELPAETTENEKLLTSHDADLTQELMQPVPKTSVNTKFTTPQPSNTAAQTSRLMNVTQDFNSSGHMSVTQRDVSSKDATFDLVEADQEDKTQNSTVNGNVTHTINLFSEESDKSAGENVTKAQLEVTRDITMDGTPSMELSEQNVAKIQTPDEDKLDASPVNVTRDINTSDHMSVQCTVSCLSASDTQCNASSKDATSELPAETTENEKLLTSHDADLTQELMQPVPKTSVNTKFTTPQPSNTAAQTSRLMNVTQDFNSSGHMSVTQRDVSSKDATFDLVEADQEDKTQNSTVNGNVTHTINLFSEESDKSAGENVTKAQLEVTRDITMDGTPSMELSEQNVAKIQTPDEDKLDASPVNVTRDINTSDHMSVQCTVSCLSASDTQCNASSKDATSELPAETTENEKLLTSHDADLTQELMQPVPKTSVNTKFTTPQPSNTAAQTSRLMNVTQDFNSSGHMSVTQRDVSSKDATFDLVEADQEDKTQNSTVNGNVTHTINLSSEESDKSAGENVTKAQLEVTRDITMDGTPSMELSEQNVAKIQTPDEDKLDASPVNVTRDINTSDHMSVQCTVSCLSASDTQCNASSKDATSELPVETIDPIEPDNEKPLTSEVILKTAGSVNSTFTTLQLSTDLNSTAQTSCLQNKTSDLPSSHVEGPTAESEAPSDSKNTTAPSIDLDDTLHWCSDNVITSTPINHKLFNFVTAQNEGETMPAQKKLYGDSGVKPVSQLPSDVPSNLVCDRKTFFPQPAAKAMLLPSKPSQLLKYKPASKLPRCSKPSGLPTMRPKTQFEVLRNPAASGAPQETAGIPSSYNLFSATTGSKQPISALPKTQMSRIPSGIQRFAPGLRPPVAMSITPATSTEKLCGPTATNPVAKTSQSKKHPLTRNEPLTTAKKKKMDAAVSASTAEISTSCDAASQQKTLKRLATNQRVMLLKGQDHGCTKCSALLEENQKLKEEIEKLKEEMLKPMKEKDKY